MRQRTTTAGLVVDAGLLTGCGPDEVACPAIGYSHSLEVTQRGGTWIFVLWGTPDTATIQVRDHADDVVAKADVPVDWVQVDGTPECGGPHEGTAVVVL